MAIRHPQPFRYFPVNTPECGMDIQPEWANDPALAESMPESPAQGPSALEINLGPAEALSEQDTENQTEDRSFLMTLLRALSAWST
jgi:hypothetical protein